MKLQLAHIINPFIADPSSDLAYAQPITFETMHRAKEMAADVANIELMAASFPDDESIIPSYFKKASFLQESVLDYGNFSKKIRLPLIRQILEKAINESDAEYIIYSNADIGLFPDFYQKVVHWIHEGHDALIINRKRIPEVFTQVQDIEKIWKLEGKPHPGFDCFVFHRDLFAHMHLENICIGVPFIEITFSQNLFHLAKKFRLIKTGDHTFHIGMEIFKKRAPQEYFAYNRNEYRKAIGKLDPVLKSKNLPFAKNILPVRLIQYGLHPCIPIKLAMKLEWRKYFGKSTG